MPEKSSQCFRFSNTCFHGADFFQWEWGLEQKLDSLGKAINFIPNMPTAHTPLFQTHMPDPPEITQIYSNSPPNWGTPNSPISILPLPTHSAPSPPYSLFFPKIPIFFTVFSRKNTVQNFFNFFLKNTNYIPIGLF